MMQQDLFQITFKILQQQLAEKSNPYCTDSNSGHDNNRFCLSIPIVMDIKKTAKRRLENINKMRELSRSRANFAIKVNQIVTADITSKKNAAFQSTCHRKAALHQRLLQQQQISERRLRELIFEITGEYGKSEMRIHRRYEFMRISGRINITQCIWRLRWEKFSHRLSYEACKSRSDKRKFNSNNSIQSEVLNLRDNIDEIKSVTEKLRRRSASEPVTSMKVVAVIRYVRKIDIPVQSNTNTNLVNLPNTIPKPKPLVTNQVTDMQTFLHEIKMWSLSGNTTGTTRTSSNNGSMTPTTRNNQTNNATTATVTAAHNMLKELISCSCIEWLHPPSYLTDLFDHKLFKKMQIKPTSSKMSNRNKFQHNHSSSNMSTPSVVADGFDEFAEGFASQHSSFLCSERLYFCLEERAIAYADEELTKLISSNNTAGYESPSVILMMLLQKYYVIHAGTTMTDNSNNSKLSLVSVRALLHSGMLVVEEYLGRHRSMAMDAGIRSELLESFPDIIQARCPGGELLHFAPAILLNLPECSTFSSLSMTEEEVHLVGSKCPHPYLSLLSGNRRSILESLYCLARITPLPLFDTNDNDIAVSNSETVSNEGTVGMMTVRNTSLRQPTQTYLCPLSRPCALELLRNYLWNDKTLLELPSAYSTAIASFVDLLPDHARVRRCETATLRHTYALMFDEYEISSKVPSDDDSTGGGGGSGVGVGGGYPSQVGSLSSSSQVVTKSRPCCYFIQLWSDNVAAMENTTRKVDSIDAPILSSHQKDDVVLRAMLSAYTQGLGQASLSTESANTSILLSKKKWDPAILSTLCRWRACLCESTDDPPPKYLCRYHSELKIFLDGRIGSKGSVGESAKYLPQKPPSIPLSVNNKDLVLIRAASTLLQELWDGKLKSTVRSFAKRVCYDMTLTTAHKNQNNNNSSDAERKSLRPSWARWKEEGELRRVLQNMSATFGGFDAILKIEKLISSELQAIFELGVFPTAELAVMRKDTKIFKDQMLEDPIGEFEMKLCERKLHLLRARRDEEQSARIAIQRRIMKVKAMEENQFKDPANFRNQRKF